jgi:Carboxypeptidase regulatory-like domain/TonB dependent receptor
MKSFGVSDKWPATLRRMIFASAALTTGLGIGFGQSTFGTIVGTVQDPSGSVVTDCKVTIRNVGTDAQRAALTDQSGNYDIPNIEPGNYEVVFEAPGFQRTVAQLELLARQTARIDGHLPVATQSETVNVEATGAPTINTEVSNLSETKQGRELVDLPVAIATRSTGSTSPMSTLTTQPGVQTDASGNISVAGTKPSMLSMTIDGITSMGPRTAGPITEMFPAFYSIAEIKVSEVNNTAEFAGISDITTISKSGSNQFHGGFFENLQNTDLEARNEFSATKPQLIMNDFGAYLGGPLSVPHFYSGKDRTFFFMSYEGLRLPRQTVIVETVPSLALRQGDLSAYSSNVYAPGSNAPFPNNQIPLTMISPIALNALKYLFSAPNTGPLTGPASISNNLAENFPTPINSDQGDIRIDQNINSKQQAYARFTYKKRSVINAPTTTLLVGPFSAPEIDFGLTVAHNFLITPTVVNELRTGFNGNHYATLFNANPATYVNEIGVAIPPPYPNASTVPNFSIAGFQTSGGTNSSISRNDTFQLLDNLTWIKHSHTIKIGGDYRYMTGFYSNVFASDQLGVYKFSGAVTSSVQPGASNPYIGNPYAAFLLGVPDQTQLATVIQPNTEAYAYSLGFFTQDDWKITSRLTLNYGLRWEYHPMFQDHLNNVTNFDPDYLSVVNGQLIRGAVILPDQAAFNILNPGFAQSIAPMPILTAAQDGLPQGMRFSQKTDFAPRVGFAWRATADGKTVIRGGYGRFIEGPLGSLISAQWGVHTSNYGAYNQTIVNGQPTLQFPYPFPSNLAQPGQQTFYQSQDIHFQDPYLQQWNLTFERDLGKGVGVRVSYDGSHGSDLGRQGMIDAPPVNTIGYTAAVKDGLLPFPQFAIMETETNGGYSNFHSGTVTFKKRFAQGLQFQGTYTFARNLCSCQGYNPSAFATEAGGVATELSDPGLDYGNVAYTRKNRVVATFLYELPFGKGKMFVRNSNGVLDRIVGGWELAGYMTFQSGPWLTVTVPSADPSGTGFATNVGNGRADTVAGVPLYPAHQTLNEWLNPAAFAVPPNNIGRFGDSPAGYMQGPGTQSVSMSLMKGIRFTESARLQIGAQAANLFNHANYAVPNTTFNTAPFGTISNLQSAEGAGPRTLQLAARLTF